MKRSLLSYIVLLLFLAGPASAQKSPTAEVVLRKVAAKLASLKQVGYTYTRELNYASEDYLSKATATSYLDLAPTEGTSGFRFQSADDDYIAIYNGSESFVAVKKKKIMVVTDNPPLRMLESSSSLYNSPLTLRNVLPKIITDPKIAKKLSREGDRYLVEFVLPKATISGLGDIRELRSERVSIYRVAIDAKTFLPLEVLLTNNENKDFTRTTFSNFDLRPAPPSDLSWYFSTYTNEYKIEDQAAKKLLPVGDMAPAFSLADFQTKTPVSLEKYKGKVVLLEFWIAHCGFCIAAVPKLNDIRRTFSDPNFEFVSINVHDPAATIASFKTRHKPEYTILGEGEATGDAYGVGAYPALVLIGKDGKIAYASSGLFEEELKAAIKKSLDEQ